MHYKTSRHARHGTLECISRNGAERAGEPKPKVAITLKTCRQYYMSISESYSNFLSSFNIKLDLIIF
jgi:hypothetical protein